MQCNEKILKSMCHGLGKVALPCELSMKHWLFSLFVVWMSMTYCFKQQIHNVPNQDMIMVKVENLS